MNYTEILRALREFASRERIELLPPALEAQPISDYPPLQKYVLDLKNAAKPETAAEDLFTALCKDVLGLQPTRQVGAGEGWVDFMLPEWKGEPVPVELKPLFQRAGPDALCRSDASPHHHAAQIKRYLREHEYLILTDLRAAWFFNARDYFFENQPFAESPFADFLARCRETGSVLDALRRVEDTAEKPELEQQFFEDLRVWFNEFDKVRWTPADRAAESIILLINKLIFARTIEDFGLVQHRFVQDEYARFVKLWEPKGAHRVVPKFLEFFEEFFDEYYDTEIFSERIWDRLDKAPANLQRFADKLNFVLGANAWEQTFSRGIVHYNYRRIDEDIFGKSYEMFLAAHRKDEGIYYTPAGITTPMADALVESLAGGLVEEICAAAGNQRCDFARAEQLMTELGEIRVADTACGSGGFLIKVLRGFWRQYQRIDAACAWVQKILRPENGELYLAELPPNVEAALGFRRRHNFDNRRVLIAQLLLRHVFGVDKDPGALEVAKTNIWKEAVKLSPADYNYRQLRTEVVRILPNLELNFHCADSLVDVALEKQASWLAEYHQAELRKLSDLRARYMANPTLHEPLHEALALRQRVRADLLEHFQGEDLPLEPAGFALHFWPCWFAPDGQPREAAGFDGVIGNPPWEGFKPIRKEFAAGFYRGKPQFSKMGMDGPSFEQWFAEEVKTNQEFAARWREHEEHYRRHKEFFSKTFRHQGTGDWNLFKLFIERDLSLVRQGGRFSLLVPSGFQTDEGCAELRRWLIAEHRLEELTSFENRGWGEADDSGKERRKQIFPDVDSRFKFGFFKVVKGAPTPKDHTFDARFYLHDPKDASAPPIRYSLEMVSAFSPENLAFMEFRSPRDYALARRIRGNHPLLGALGYQFRRELHLTGDARFLRKIQGRKLCAGEMPLLEGKSIFQFDSKFSLPSWFVVESEVRPELLRKEVFRVADFVRAAAPEAFEGKPLPQAREELEETIKAAFERRGFRLHYEFDRLAYREVGSSTNERTLIASILPSRACFSHKLMYLTPCRYSLGAEGALEQTEVPVGQVRALLALLNSLTLNSYARSKVSTGVSVHHLYELPIPELNPSHEQRLAGSAAELLKSPHDVQARAQMEVFVARELYGLSLADWKHLTGTFTFGSGPTKQELDEIIRQSLLLWPA